MPRDYRLYLDDIIEAIARIREYSSGLDEEGIASDRKTQDAIVRNLEIIGEAARSLPDEIKERAALVDWRKFV